VSPYRAIVLDSGGLSALVDGDERVRALMRQANDRDLDVVIPTTVLVESLTGSGPRDARVNALIEHGGSEVPSLDLPTARRAAELRARSKARGASVTDAVVAAEGITRGRALVVTSDPTDIRALVGASGSVDVQTV
jgi:predicted nucleic acid-binding protein